MRKKFYFLWLIAIIITTQSLSQTTTVISYQNIAGGYLTGPCFFNIPPGPTAPISIGGFDHYGIVGGVYYSGNEFQLNTSPNGNGTAFGIYYPFSKFYKYRIVVTAKATSPYPSPTLQVVTNSVRTSIPSSCSPAFATIITQGADLSTNNYITSYNYADYLIADNYTPTTDDITYLLLGNFPTSYVNINGVLYGGTTNIQTITITATLICPIDGPTNLSAIPASGGYYIHFTQVSNITGYSFDWFDLTTNAQGGTTQIGYSSGNDVSNFVNSITAGHSFKFRIAAYTSCGLGNYSAYSAPIIPNPCGLLVDPNTLLGTNACGTGNYCSAVLLSWGAVPNATSYQVDYTVFDLSTGYITSTGNYITSSTSTYGLIGGYTTSYTLVVHLRVRARCSGGVWGDYSVYSANFAL